MRARRKQRGFTLLEIMVVVVILGLLASMVSVSVMGNKDKAEIQKACSDLSTLEEAMDLFNLGNHFYPTTDQGLDALVHKPSVGTSSACRRIPGAATTSCRARASTASMTSGPTALTERQAPRTMSTTGHRASAADKITALRIHPA